MKKDDKARSNKFYEDRLKLYGPDDHRSQGWFSRDSQKLRYQVLSLIGNIYGSKILDVGCGLGDFYNFLKEAELDVDYAGYDISSKMTEAARRKYPQAKFIVKDILEEEVADRFDYVFAPGVLSFGIEGAEEYAQQMIKKMYELADCGLAFNLLSSYAAEEIRYDDLYYFDPQKMLGFCKTICARVTLRHDYLPHDFAIYMYK